MEYEFTRQTKDNSENNESNLEHQLQQFNKLCKAHKKQKRKRRRSKRRYYNLALIAKVDKTTTHEEIKRLLKNNTRTFLVDAVTHKSHELVALTKLIRQVVNEKQSEEPNMKLTIGLALRITGETCRLGRVRNNCSLFLAWGDTMTLTTNIAYRYTCFKEIAFAINLQDFLPCLKINDDISIGDQVRGIIVKKSETAIVIRIEEIGIINSHDLIELPHECYSCPLPSLSDIISRDLEMASMLKMDFIALPHIRCLTFLKLLHHKLRSTYKFKLIGSIDLEYISCKIPAFVSIIKHLDYLWLTNLFSNNKLINAILIQYVIPVANSLRKPIIGSVTLKGYNDLKLFENHEFLPKIDCIFIEKSKWCNKYPLIVTKLLQVKNYRLSVIENARDTTDILLNIITRTVNFIECRAIFMHTKCETAAKALSCVEIYCPVFVMLPFEDSVHVEKLHCLSKCLNLRRNLRPILYSKEMNECRNKPIDYGIQYACRCGYLETGDFIITLEVEQENAGDNVQVGIVENMVLVRTMYIPPAKIGENFKCT